MPTPLALSDSQITSVMQLAAPLSPHQRSRFLEMLAARLNGRRELGDGAIHRLCRELLHQHKLFDPPKFDSGDYSSKYDRVTKRAARG